MAQLMFPNIAGQAMQGFDSGRNMAANRLIGLAMQNPDQSQQYLGQAATINPQAVMQVQDAQARNQYMQGLQQQQAQRMQQSQQEMMAKKAGAAARYWKAAMETGNPAAKAAAAQSVLPFLGQMAAAQGKPAPTAQDLESPQAMAGLDQIIAKTAYLFPDDMKLQTITPGSVQTRGGQPVYSNPAAPKIVNGMAVSPGQNGTLVASPIPISGAGAAPQAAPMGAPQAQGVDTTVPGANGQSVQFNFPPGTPPEVIAAAKASAVANGDIVPGAQVGTSQGQPGTLAQAMAAKGQVRTLSAAEVKAAGLPDGTMAQQAPDGKISIVNKPVAGGLFGGDGSNSFTPEAQELLAVATEQGLKIPIPSVGMGGAARVQFVNGLAKDINEKHIPLDLALQEMRFGLDADPGLKKSQGLYSTTKTLEAGADNLAQQAVQTAQSVGRGKIPIFNAWINAGRRATGDPDIARFDRSINAFVNDYAKVVSGSLGSAASSDSARKQAEEQLTAAQSPEQFAASVQQMQQEMHVRTDGMLDSIRQQVSNITNGGLRTDASAFGNPTAPPGAQQAPQPSSVDSILSKYGIQ